MNVLLAICEEQLDRLVFIIYLSIDDIDKYIEMRERNVEEIEKI